MKKGILIRSAVVLSMILFVMDTDLLAQRSGGRGYGPGDGSGPRHEMMFDRLSDYLELNDDQKEKIEKYHLEFQKETLTKRNEIDEKRAKLHTLMTADNPNTSEINKLADEIGSLRTQIQKSWINTHLKVRNELTEEQRIKFDSGFQRGSGRGYGQNGFRGMHGRGWK